MSDAFFKKPILNSPYDFPAKHWELDEAGQPTQRIIERRRIADFITPIPKARKRKKKAVQAELELNVAKDVSDDSQSYERTAETINSLRQRVNAWRNEPDQSKWRVTPETARLLHHWRHHAFNGIRPFFCQVEAVETAIWLTEVAPTLGKEGRLFLDALDDANEDANPGLARLALKLATGAGKTTVMAMLIAWQTVNAVRRPSSKKYTRAFLLVAPGITIRDRLRVLQPNDPNSYYRSREILPDDLLPDLGRAEIVITNYHAFKLRETMQISKGGRSLMEGRHGESMQTLETEGQMLQRVMAQLMGFRNVMVLNDEAHHCYREKPADDSDFTDEEGNALKGTDLTEAKDRAKSSNDAARLWISGIEAIQRKLGLARIFDLSATPFFLNGSGYREGTLFPWTMSDFSLMDAIECGIVKLPRVPVADNVPEAKMPMFRVLWEHIGKQMPKKRRSKTDITDPSSLPSLLCNAIDALYGHYAAQFALWEQQNIGVPPCFIFVCSNTAVSKLVYDHVSGYEKTNADGSTAVVPGRCELFRNFQDASLGSAPLPRPNTLLIDSEQLESGDALDKNFREMAGPEIDQFRREIKERDEGRLDADNLDDADLLREVMNTVGKPGRLGAQIRCVVSVSMLTEGWDANNVTHVLGIRAFGTQLLCEQVIGRALRRQSYELNEEGLFSVEYADVLGIPFDFTAKPVVAPPKPPPPVTVIKAVRPDRDALEIRFPRVRGYRVEMPDETISFTYDEDSTFELTPAHTGPAETQNVGIIGESADLNVKHLDKVRPSQLAMNLTAHLLQKSYRDDDGVPKQYLFPKLKRAVRYWMDHHLECKGGTYPAQLLYPMLGELACERIAAGINRDVGDEGQVKALLDPYNPAGSTRHMQFNTSKDDLYDTCGPPPKCHVNYAVMDSDWEAEFCRVADQHPRVLAWVKNHNLGLDVPYTHQGNARTYRPDFIVKIDDGHGLDDPLNLVVEIKGYRGEDAKTKKQTMDVYWVPGVNALGGHGRWAFAEFKDVWAMQDDFAKLLAEAFGAMVDGAAGAVS